jgi:GT2 family glycosyltransferase
MIIDTSNKHAVFDPSLTGMVKVHPHATEDSKHQIDAAGMDIQRGNGDRMAGYFKLDPKFASIHAQTYYVTIQYQDEGSGEWFLEYVPKTTSSDTAYPWRSTERIQLSGSNMKHEVCLKIENARLTGHVNGADLRIVVVDPDITSFRLTSLRITTSDTPSEPEADPFLRPSPNTSIAFGKEKAPVASIVIPVYNGLDYTLDCLKAITEFTAPGFEVVIVNNASTDQTADVLAGIPNLRLLNNSENLGFGRACNQGAELADGKYLVFLNNDTLPQPGWLSSLVSCAERHDNIGVVGSRLIFPQTNEIQSAGVRFGRYLLPEDEFQHYPVDAPEVSVDREVAALCGASILVNRSTFLETGGFDERFLNGLEDVDLCLRLQVKMLKNMLCAQSNVLHYKSATEGRFELEKDRANATLFHEKWHPYLSGVTKTNDHSRIALGQLPRRFDANFKDLNYQTGTKRNGVILCEKQNDAPGHCVFGPYLQLGDTFSACVTFTLAVSNLPDDKADIVSLDVYDSVSNKVLAEHTVRGDDIAEGELRPSLCFAGNTSQILEFRVYWHGQCDLSFSGLEVNASP